MPKTDPTPIQVSPDPPVVPVEHSVQEHGRLESPVPERENLGTRTDIDTLGNIM